MDTTDDAMVYFLDDIYNSKMAFIPKTSRIRAGRIESAYGKRGFNKKSLIIHPTNFGNFIDSFCKASEHFNVYYTLSEDVLNSKFDSPEDTDKCVYRDISVPYPSVIAFNEQYRMLFQILITRTREDGESGIQFGTPKVGLYMCVCYISEISKNGQNNKGNESFSLEGRAFEENNFRVYPFSSNGIYLKSAVSILDFACKLEKASLLMITSERSPVVSIAFKKLYREMTDNINERKFKKLQKMFDLECLEADRTFRSACLCYVEDAEKSLKTKSKMERYDLEINAKSMMGLAKSFSSEIQYLFKMKLKVLMGYVEGLEIIDLETAAESQSLI